MSQTEIESADEALNPDALTIGFARRFATYKRATLIFRDLGRLRRLVTDAERPVQFIFAGKAHPHDNEGKEFIRTIVNVARDHDFRHSVVFLENYDMNVARYMVAGRGCMAEHAAAPERGQRHQRHESYLQRRSELQHSRRLVGRGL